MFRGSSDVVSLHEVHCTLPSLILFGLFYEQLVAYV